MAEKILLVDDDPNILDGYRRSLSREFQMETALGGRRR
jgi:DNA-binding response OmpR family regulator